MKSIKTLGLALTLTGLTSMLPIHASATTYDNTVVPRTISQINQAQLFIIRAHHATVSEENGVDKLTLTEAADNVLFLGSRQVNEGGQVALSTFINYWNTDAHSFKTLSSNAVFLYDISNLNNTGVTEGNTVTLSNPVANANGTWTFDIKGVNGQIALGRYHRAVLLINSWNTNGISRA